MKWPLVFDQSPGAYLAEGEEAISPLSSPFKVFTTPQKRSSSFRGPLTSSASVSFDSQGKSNFGYNRELSVVTREPLVASAMVTRDTALTSAQMKEQRRAKAYSIILQNENASKASQYT